MVAGCQRWRTRGTLFGERLFLQSLVRSKFPSKGCQLVDSFPCDLRAYRLHGLSSHFKLVSFFSMVIPASFSSDVTVAETCCAPETSDGSWEPI